MSTTSNDALKLNKQKILDSIEQTQKYEEDNLLIRKWEGENETGQLIAKINKNKIDFLGILNSKLQREGLGFNIFSNGEKYFGNFHKDLREKHGLYLWPSIVENGVRKTEYYWGCWRDNCKDHHGVYLWLSEKENIPPYSDFDNADFDVYIGNLDMDSYVKGVYMSKIGDKYHVYYGHFDSNGKKNGDNCYYYNASFDKVLYGTFVSDKFVSGYLAAFDEDGNCIDLLKVTFKDNKIDTYQQGEEIETNIYEEVRKKVTDFRSLLLEKDYFGDIYTKFKEDTTYLDQQLKEGSIDVFDSKEIFPKLLDLSSSYNDISLFRTLEAHLSEKRKN